MREYLRACGDAGLYSLGLVGLGFRVRYKVRVGVMVGAFYFLSLVAHRSPQDRILPITVGVL